MIDFRDFILRHYRDGDVVFSNINISAVSPRREWLSRSLGKIVSGGILSPVFIDFIGSISDRGPRYGSAALVECFFFSPTLSVKVAIEATYVRVFLNLSSNDIVWR